MTCPECASLPLNVRNKIDVAPTGCWLWIGRTNRNGYGRVKAGGRTQMAHRFVYDLLQGPIPDGLTLDHLCRVRRCVNPDHLEPVTMRENVLRSPIAIPAVNARKTHCPQGHEYTPENTYFRPARHGQGYWRDRRVCNTERTRRRRMA